MYTQPFFTKLKLNPSTGGYEPVPCTFEEATSIHLGEEQFYPLRTKDGDYVWNSFGSAPEDRKPEMEARAQAIRNLGFPCEVYQYTWQVHEGDPIYSLRLQHGAIQPTAPTEERKEESDGCPQ